ncbi:MAG: hypothetical protein ACE5FN_10870 [Leptospirillia bacterium]
MRIAAFFLFLICTTLLVSHAVAEESVLVIVNKANQQALTLQDIRNIYADNVVTWADGRNRIKVLDLPLRDAARERFSKRVMNQSPRDVARFWANRKITNSARNPPLIKRAASVISMVTRDPYAIGYIPESALRDAPGIRVVFTLH